MLKECIETGKSVEEAIAAGCEKLGVDRDDISFEIISLPKKGFLGLTNTPAKVRVYVEVEDPAETTPPPQKAAQRAEAPKQQKPEAKEPAPEPAKREERTAPVADPAPEELGPLEEPCEKALAARDYLKSILVEMGLAHVNIDIAQRGGTAVFTLTGEGLGVIIGRRGETLDSLQYLTGLVANRLEGDYMRITIDSGNYREKREKTLQGLAKKLAGNAVRTGRSSTLEPMNPYERRIIHAAVSQIEGATSTSVGEEPNRRVVISSTNPRRNSGPRRDNRSGGNRGGGSNRSGGGGGYNKNRPPRSNDRGGDRRSGDRPEPYTASTTREKAPSEAVGKPLYGKIELD